MVFFEKYGFFHFINLIRLGFLTYLSLLCLIFVKPWVRCFFSLMFVGLFVVVVRHDDYDGLAKLKATCLFSFNVYCLLCWGSSKDSCHRSQKRFV